MALLAVARAPAALVVLAGAQDPVHRLAYGRPGDGLRPGFVGGVFDVAVLDAELLLVGVCGGDVEFGEGEVAV